jgi:hypothetical protein
MIAPAWYCISGGNFGGGLDRYVSVELGQNVNLSSSENTFVCHVLLGAVVVDDVDRAEGVRTEGTLSFSFPRPEALVNTFKDPRLPFAAGTLDPAMFFSLELMQTPAAPTPYLAPGNLALAGWEVTRGLSNACLTCVFISV